jgi:hypothetical protein
MNRKIRLTEEFLRLSSKLAWLRATMRWLDVTYSYWERGRNMNKQIYRLIFSSFYRIYDVFHVFYLLSYKRRKDDRIVSKYFSFELLDDDEISEIKKILQKKISKKIIYYLIKWKNWSEKYNEWIAEKNINALDLFQEFDEQTKKRRKIR